MLVHTEIVGVHFPLYFPPFANSEAVFVDTRLQGDIVVSCHLLGLFCMIVSPALAKVTLRTFWRFLR